MNYLLCPFSDTKLTQTLDYSPGTQPVGLSREATAAKMMAMRAYLTEFDAIDDDFGGVASTADLMRHETYWTVT
ncbi:hypothetical protein DM794_19900 [Paenarthrobacter ureafaciens]|nr:hypothetical protein [Paenarthrobacter ureafaciens]BCW84048.1 hypothetical protein NicSoilE8_17210 [Arthrobacter sp. NicSoilE8]